MYLNCHVTSHDHLIKGSCKFMDGSSLWYVTALIKSCNSGGVIFSICQATSRETLT